ncbi:MAG TPA: GNAT family N-acetyltransferase [Candidatus Binatia bacterium]|nr:GNAT family N-acetyltransferase [Candidatus Binatia bacterium]
MTLPTRVRVTSDPAGIDLRLAHRWIAGSYWAAGIPWETFERACAHSLCFAAMVGQEQVGFARVVTDQATFAWLADVYVAEGARGRGVGARLVAAVTDDPRLQGLRRFILATADAHGLYERFGFQRVGDANGRLMSITRSATQVYGDAERAAQGS